MIFFFSKSEQNDNEKSRLERNMDQYQSGLDGAAGPSSGPYTVQQCYIGIKNNSILSHYQELSTNLFLI